MIQVNNKMIYGPNFKCKLANKNLKIPKMLRK